MDYAQRAQATTGIVGSSPPPGPPAQPPQPPPTVRPTAPPPPPAPPPAPPVMPPIGATQVLPDETNRGLTAVAP